jgi:hypothetical protein
VEHSTKVRDVLAQVPRGGRPYGLA